MRTWVIGFSLVVPIACGKSHRDEPSPEASQPGGAVSTADLPFTSGTRLRARVFDGGDGAIALYEWYDAQLDTSCTFRRAIDDVIRCLPDERDSRPHLTPNDIVYVDFRCSSPVALFNADLELPEYVIVDPEVRRCEKEMTRYPVQRVGEELSALPGDLHYRVGEKCYLLGEVDLSARALKAARLGDAVNPQLFVAAELVPTKSTERLSPVELLGSDGSRQRAGVWDSEKAAECTPLWGDGAPCVPPFVAWRRSDWFTDSACTEPQAYVSSSTPLNGAGADEGCPPPAVAVDYAPSDDACADWTYTLYEVGPAATSHYSLSAGECTLRGDPERLGFELGMRLPEGAFDSVRSALVGNGRLKLEVTATRGGARLDHEQSGGLPYFVDTLLDTPCSPVATCDGGLFCAPEPGLNGNYSDSACTEPVTLLSLSSECEAEGRRFFSNRGYDGACWDGTLLELADELEPTELYFRNSNGECITQGGPTDARVRRLVASSESPALVVDRIE